VIKHDKRNSCITTVALDDDGIDEKLLTKMYSLSHSSSYCKIRQQQEEDTTRKRNFKRFCKFCCLSLLKKRYRRSAFLPHLTHLQFTIYLFTYLFVFFLDWFNFSHIKEVYSFNSHTVTCCRTFQYSGLCVFLSRNKWQVISLVLNSVGRYAYKQVQRERSSFF